MRFRAVFCPAFFTAAVWVFQLAAGEPSAPTNTPSSSTTAADDFDSLVKRGDQARLKRDYITAIKAYRDALALREDALIEGRLGLLLFEIRVFDVAAQHLHHAVEKSPKAVSDAEFAKFSSALRASQKEVCRIDVEVDRRGTRLEIDGDVVQEGKGEFWFYVLPGKHKLHVSLEGFEDEIQEIDAPKGDQMRAKFTMRPIAKPTPEAKKPAAHEPTPSPRTSEPIIVPEDKPTAKTNPPSKGKFVVGGGLAFVLGATPKPALGPQAFVAWRSRSWWEIGLDARVGGTVVEDERFPGLGFVAWSAGVTPCARLRDRFFGCALAQMEGVARDDGARSSYLPGAGLRAGVDIAVMKRLRLQVWGDAVVRPRGFRFILNELSGSFMTGTFGIRAACLL